MKIYKHRFQEAYYFLRESKDNISVICFINDISGNVYFLKNTSRYFVDEFYAEIKQYELLFNEKLRRNFVEKLTEKFQNSLTKEDEDLWYNDNLHKDIETIKEIYEILDLYEIDRGNFFKKYLKGESNE